MKGQAVVESVNNVFTAFKSRKGAQQAIILAAHTVRVEELSNIDECIEAFTGLIYALIDEKSNANMPVSAFVEAEVHAKLHKRRDRQKFRVAIQTN